MAADEFEKLNNSTFQAMSSFLAQRHVTMNQLISKYIAVLQKFFSKASTSFSRLNTIGNVKQGVRSGRLKH